jgi:hypothetical protein
MPTQRCAASPGPVLRPTRTAKSTERFVTGDFAKREPVATGRSYRPCGVMSRRRRSPHSRRGCPAARR